MPAGSKNNTDRGPGAANKPTFQTRQPNATATVTDPAPYTAKEAADFARQGACMIALAPDEIWRDPFLGEKGNGGGVSGLELARGGK